MKLLAVYLICLKLVYSLELDSQCDNHGTLVYEDMHCTPVMKEGHKCPVEFKCDLEAKSNTCRFRNRDIPVGSSLSDNDTYSACTVGCSCQENHSFECAELDCPENEAPGPTRSDCYLKYKLGECCSVGTMCARKDNPAECKVNGATVMEGEEFYPQNTCLSCVCGKGFTGKYTSEFCQRRSCLEQVHNSDKIKENCAPFYLYDNDKPLCCPHSWVCQASSNVTRIAANPKADQNTGLTCKFGSDTYKLGERMETVFKSYDVTRRVQCECMLPPFLTCRQKIIWL
ncbi:unnamed protein product [Diabrotica balteata]|uniref:VWFC domain-containing protein n=1 Tax=Diabrotica balteata TaxID=107213 RepID=A0A9N9X667_DIABA|nr:unnamed protein product [Diabrotica balteata]